MVSPKWVNEMCFDDWRRNESNNNVSWWIKILEIKQ